MKGYEHEISGTIIVNASDPSVNSDARYMVVKLVDGVPWYYTSFDDLRRAQDVVDATKPLPTFIIDRGEP